MHNGSIAQIVIVLTFFMGGMVAFSKTAPYYTIVVLFMGYFIALLVHVLVMRFGFGDWWCREPGFDELGK